MVFYFSLNKERKFSLLNRSYSIIDLFAKIYENFDTRIEGARSKSLQVRLKSTIWITAKPLLKAWNNFLIKSLEIYKIDLTFKRLVCGPDLTLSSDLIKKI